MPVAAEAHRPSLVIHPPRSRGDVPGFESISVAILFLGGMQLLTLGIIGSCIGRIFNEVKGRPLYVVHETYRGRRSGLGSGRSPEASHVRKTVATSCGTAGGHGAE